MEYVAPAEPEGIRIYYKGKDVTNGTVYYEMINDPNNNRLQFTDKILGGKYDATKATWSVSAENGDVDDQGKKTGDVYNILIKSTTITQFEVYVQSDENKDLKAKVTVNVAHPINILQCDADKHFNLGQTHHLNIDENELRSSPLKLSLIHI